MAKLKIDIDKLFADVEDYNIPKLTNPTSTEVVEHVNGLVDVLNKLVSLHKGID